MKQKKQRPPMYFTSLKIKNVKSFGSEQELNFLNEDGAIARWTLILGDYGVGKTTLLKCLTWMVPVQDKRITFQDFGHDIKKDYLKTCDWFIKSILIVFPYLCLK